MDIDALNASTLKAYEAKPSWLKEHYGIEQTVLAGGYGYRQILELVQNGADAILEARDHDLPSADGNRVHVMLRGSRLYVANTGASLSPEGVEALLGSHSSPKRGNQIGRFGLGFKSLLKLDGRIDLLTRTSGGIRFDPQRCRDELQQRFKVTDAPGLRLAWSLDASEREADDVCAELAWAETIVRVEVQAPHTLEYLRQEIRAFPAEFLLFFPVPIQLVLDDSEQPPREVRVHVDADHYVLHDGANASRWRVTSRDIRIVDRRALDDATHIHARESVPLTWAVPLEGRREEAGRFWAFFPTHTPTYVPGILNAPWKLNSDRNAIIGGEWNTALMAEAASLVADTLPRLSSPEDPARPLDSFPRQLERRDEDAAPLVEALWKKLETAVIIPDAAGMLQEGRDLWRHPRESAELVKQWQVLADPEDSTRFVHSSCLERQRNSRLNVLAERLADQKNATASGMLQRYEAASWFKVVASSEVAEAIPVLKLAEGYKNDCKPEEWHKIRPQLAIILSETGELLTASQVVLAPDGTNIPGRASVARVLHDDAEAKRILAEVMKVQAPDDDMWEQVLRESMPNIRHYPPEANDGGWRAFWSRLRQAPAGVRDRFVQLHRSEIRIRRRDGAWHTADEVLLPGALIASDDTSGNKNVLVDDVIHSGDSTILEAIGVCDIPDGDVGPDQYDRVAGKDTLGEWLQACRRNYKDTHDNSASRNYLEPFSLTMPKGFGFLTQLNGRPNARLTQQYLKRIAQGAFSESVQFGHSTTPSKYPKIDVPHPLLWFLLRHGLVEIGDTAVRLAAVIARRNERALSKLPACNEWSAVFDKLQHAFPNVQPNSDDINVLWLTLIETFVTPETVAADTLTDLWAASAKDGVVPEALPSSRGPVPLGGVFVTNSPDLARHARTSERIVVTLDEKALNLWIENGAHDLAELMSPKYSGQMGPVGLLASTMPELAEVLLDEVKDTARCQPVSGLNLVITEHVEAIPCLMWGNALLLDLEQLALQSRADRLQRLLNEVAAAEWLKHKPEEALRILGDAQVDKLRAKVAQGATLAERLLLAVGNRVEPLRQALGGLENMDFIQQCEPLKLAELTLAQVGPATLTILKDTLEAEGLKPPSRWNKAEARTFVASVGFPVEFAASSEARREPEESISGPIELPPLHDFQQEVMQGIEALLASGTTRRRAVVSLPTGGGKTRVTVEAAVRLVLAPEGSRRSVVWVAQTDELCEQAVQAFRQVWINLGAQRTDLRIVRLWGGNPNPAAQTSDQPVVVIASIQTLNSRMGADGLGWLSNPGLVVVDECHHAITPSYTSLLRWLDAEAQRLGAPQRDEPPILGLSATPFRTDDEESQRLAKRFDNRWLPSDQQALHTRLRTQGVLARAVYEALESGAKLLDEEIERLAKLPEPWEGLDFENLLEAINQRLAGDTKRNELLVDHIRQYAEQSILFFTNSVQHAEEMSARLNLAGIPAAAVSGNTPAVARRYFLDRFQRGEIRVLCNHSVLTTGFDAPRTDMVLIARQVFSPVRYMQMVGRGLRGEKNGGTADCRIVTVVDNLGRFQNRHPYDYCRQYFEGA